mgnify:CR=1 FL=1
MRYILPMRSRRCRHGGTAAGESDTFDRFDRQDLRPEEKRMILKLKRKRGLAVPLLASPLGSAQFDSAQPMPTICFGAGSFNRPACLSQQSSLTLKPHPSRVSLPLGQPNTLIKNVLSAHGTTASATGATTSYGGFKGKERPRRRTGLTLARTLTLSLSLV